MFEHGSKEGSKEVSTEVPKEVSKKVSKKVPKPYRIVPAQERRSSPYRIL